MQRFGARASKGEAIASHWTAPESDRGSAESQGVIVGCVIFLHRNWKLRRRIFSPKHLATMVLAQVRCADLVGDSSAAPRSLWSTAGGMELRPHEGAATSRG